MTEEARKYLSDILLAIGLIEEFTSVTPDFPAVVGVVTNKSPGLFTQYHPPVLFFIFAIPGISTWLSLNSFPHNALSRGSRFGGSGRAPEIVAV